MIARPKAGGKIPMVRPSVRTISTLFLRTLPISGVAGFAVICLNGAHGQSAPSLRPEFEVASVKPHSSSEGSPHVSIARDPGRLTYTNITVRGLIREAYGLKLYPLSRGPDALSTDR